MHKILVIDDELDMLSSIERIFTRRPKTSLQLENDPKVALEAIKNNHFDVILTDLNMTGVSGMEILQKALDLDPQAIVIMISGYGTVQNSVTAMKNGAFDFIEKPFASKKLFDSIDRALKSREHQEDQVPHGESLAFAEELGIVFQSNEMEDILKLTQKVAPKNMNILITGESGTGKEVIARAIHRLSKRNSAPFVPVNCGALPEHLFESELFGHEKGAFTGAFKKKPGLLEFANKGSFFLDEIGELSMPLQVKLLRMLEERKIRRVGGSEEIDIDVRIIAASNKDIEAMVKEESFREDLYYRLNTIHIEIPPLRERKDDILPLANDFIIKLRERNESEVEGFTRGAEAKLINYAWPGNIRELQNILSRATFLASSQLIESQDLPIVLEDDDLSISKKYLSLDYHQAKEKAIEMFETQYLVHHLKLNKGNVTKTAKQCNLDRRSVHRLINKYSIIYDEDK